MGSRIAPQHLQDLVEAICAVKALAVDVLIEPIFGTLF
jgi:hypothetical protein